MLCICGSYFSMSYSMDMKEKVNLTSVTEEVDHTVSAVEVNLTSAIEEVDHHTDKNDKLSLQVQ